MRVRSSASIVALLLLLFGLVSTGTATASVTSTAPTASSSNPGCPETFQTWQPHVGKRISGTEGAELAPGRLSKAGRASVGARLAHWLAGRDVSWLSSLSCEVRPDKGPKPPAKRPVLGSNTGDFSSNWSGYEADGGGFTSASMDWTVPAINTPYNISAADSIWPGVGQGTSSDALIQAGTQTQHLYYYNGAYVSDAIFFWIEIYPQESEVQISNMKARAGDSVGATVEWEASTKTAVFTLCNFTANKCGQATQTNNSGVSGSSAEWIVERPTQCATTCNYPSLNNMGNEAITNAGGIQTAGGVSTGNYIPGFSNYHSIVMNNCAGTETLATPSYPPSSTGAFNDQWQNYGPSEFC